MHTPHLDPSRADKRAPRSSWSPLLAGLIAAQVVPALWNYFGLTRPAGIAYHTALPVLVNWFLALAAAYRFRVIDRLLSLPTWSRTALPNSDDRGQLWSGEAIRASGGGSWSQYTPDGGPNS